MLEFIVSGQIPGTHLVITFSWFVVITVAVGGGLIIHSLERRQQHDLEQTAIENIAL